MWGLLKIIRVWLTVMKRITMRERDDFVDGNESSAIYDLTLENQVDCVSLYGKLQNHQRSGWFTGCQKVTGLYE